MPDGPPGPAILVRTPLLQGRAGSDAADHHAALVLRMLGLTTDDAAEVDAAPAS